MSASSLGAAGAIAATVGIAYLLVAWNLRRRGGLGADTRRALDHFALWWGALGLNLFVVAFVYFWGALSTIPLVVQLVDSVLQRLLLSFSMIGLMAYLSFVVTGKSRLKLFVATYGVFFLLSLSAMVYQQPKGVFVGAWRTDLEYAHEGAIWISLVNFGLLLLPPIVGAIAYARLIPKAETPAQKYRIALVSASILVWWIVAVLAGQRLALSVEWLQIGQRVLGLATSLAVLAAYRPPGFIRRRLGVEAYAT